MEKQDTPVEVLKDARRMLASQAAETQALADRHRATAVDIEAEAFTLFQRVHQYDNAINILLTASPAAVNAGMTTKETTNG